MIPCLDIFEWIDQCKFTPAQSTVTKLVYGLNLTLEEKLIAKKFKENLSDLENFKGTLKLYREGFDSFKSINEAFENLIID